MYHLCFSDVISSARLLSLILFRAIALRFIILPQLAFLLTAHTVRQLGNFLQMTLATPEWI